MTDRTRAWTRNDSVEAEVKYGSKSVLDFIEKRFTGEDTFDFENKNSFYFAVILCEKFSLKIIWDNLNFRFYAGQVGETSAVLYNIKGMVILEDNFRVNALKEFSYDDEALYDQVDEEFIK